MRNVQCAMGDRIRFPQWADNVFEKIAFSIFLLSSFATTAMANNQTIEYGDAPELIEGCEKIFVDVRADMSVLDNIIVKIRRNLLPAKRDLQIVSKPENSDIHLQFYYESQTVYGGAYPGGRIVRMPVGTVVKILGKNRAWLLMSYSVERRSYWIAIGLGLGRRVPEAEFAREFVKAYLTAKSPQ
jgi:hypothetical protein